MSDDFAYSVKVALYVLMRNSVLVEKLLKNYPTSQPAGKRYAMEGNPLRT